MKPGMRTSVWSSVARLSPKVGFGIADSLAVALSLFLSFLLRFDGAIPERYASLLLGSIPLAVALKVPFFILLRLYRFSWAYVGLEELYDVLLACAGGSAALTAFLFLTSHWAFFSGMPRSVLGIDFALTLLLVSGIRLAKRLALHAFSPGFRRPGNSGQRTLVVGAGEAGEKLVRAILSEDQVRFLPVGFIDDDPAKKGLIIHGVRILGPRDRLVHYVDALKIKSVIVAMPSASSRTIRETVELARQAGVAEVKILPFLSELYTGEVRTSEVREVQPEDLLRREPVPIDRASIERFIQGKRVLVTGAAGSIGSELCRQALRFGAAALYALDIDETGLFNLETDLKRRIPGREVAIVVGDVRDQKVVVRVFQRLRPELVFHAAAYKHVPMMEAFPGEAVKTNVFGTVVVAQEACRAGAEAFIFISTDKAVNPTSVMGATKRLAEMASLALGQEATTRFMGVRFGNVLGSRGSVLLTFMDQIRRGGPVTVTHPEMTRYFMTTAEAVGLVMQAAAMGKGGEVFVLDMGEPVKILDLAHELICFQGLEPDRDIPIVFTGVRPGEKLFEELLTAEEGTDVTSHRSVFVARLGRPWTRERLDDALRLLEGAVTDGDHASIVAALGSLVPTYRADQHPSSPPT